MMDPWDWHIIPYLLIDDTNQQNSCHLKLLNTKINYSCIGIGKFKKNTSPIDPIPHTQCMIYFWLRSASLGVKCRYVEHLGMV